MTNIVICAENSVTRAGLAAMATTATSQVIAQVGSVLALSTWLQTQGTDLAVVALSAPEETEISHVIELVEALPTEEKFSVLLLINDWGDMAERSVSRLVAQALSTGMVSLLPMTVSANQMRDAIAAITQGLLILHPDIIEALFTPDNQPFSPIETDSDALLEPLTSREIQVLNQLAGGLTNKAIAKKLSISEHTVKFHISAMLSKLGVTSRTEAVTVGIRAGLVML